jgi:dCTP diphosphatase
MGQVEIRDRGASAMNDETTRVAELKELLAKFVGDRAWEKYHRPKELAAAIIVEAGELLECFQWLDEAEVAERLKDPDFREGVEDEMADVLAFVLSMANRLGTDLAGSLERKMAKNEAKYPAREYHGRWERKRSKP